MSRSKINSAAAQRLARARGQFRVKSDLIHLNAMLVASNPEPVRNAIRRYQRDLDRDPDGHIRSQLGPGGNFRRVIQEEARYLGIDPAQAQHHLLQTESTTAGLALLYHGLHLLPGQEILTTPHDFYSTRESLRLLSRKSGAAVREFRLFKNSAKATSKEILKNVEEAIGPRTRVLALTWVHSNTGVKLPIAKIGELVESLNESRTTVDRITFCVDGVHGFGIENVKFEDLHCDFFVSGCHKWIFGPRGTGLICGRPERWAELIPTTPSLNPGKTPGGILSYEYFWAVADAFAFHLHLGKAAVQAHTWGLARRLKKGLKDLPGVTLVTPMSSRTSSGIVCCDVAGWQAREIVEELRNTFKILASVSSDDPDAGNHLRFSPSILNTADEIDTAIGAVRTILGSSGGRRSSAS